MLLEGLFLNKELLEDTVSDDIRKYGVMIACYPSKDVTKKLVMQGGNPEDELHLTLVYIGKTKDVKDVDKLKSNIEKYCKNKKSLKGRISGLGRFNSSNSSDSKDVLYVSVDIPDLPEFRQGLVQACEKSGIKLNKTHGYTPHITLTYLDSKKKTPMDKIDNINIDFDKITLVYGEEITDFSLK